MTMYTAAGYYISILRGIEVNDNVPRERAVEILREMSGEDYGNDVEAWRRWARRNGKLILGQSSSDDFEDE